MSSPTPPLQFDRAVPVGAPPPTAACGVCRAPLLDSYFTAKGVAVCPRCKEQFSGQTLSGTRLGRFSRALLFGAGAGLLGALIWFAIRKATGYEIGLVAVAVGVMVGRAVRAGSRRTGGKGYQFLAVAITYFAICMNYAPDVVQMLVKDFREHRHGTSTSLVSHTPATHASATRPSAAAPAASSDDEDDDGADPTIAPDGTKRSTASVVGRGLLAVALLVVLVIGVSLAAPIIACFGGGMGFIGLLIIGFALWEAWKTNRVLRPVFAGPFVIPRRPQAGPVSVASIPLIAPPPPPPSV